MATVKEITFNTTTTNYSTNAKQLMDLILSEVPELVKLDESSDTDVYLAPFGSTDTACKLEFSSQNVYAYTYVKDSDATSNAVTLGGNVYYRFGSGGSSRICLSEATTYKIVIIRVPESLALVRIQYGTLADDSYYISILCRKVTDFFTGEERILLSYGTNTDVTRPTITKNETYSTCSVHSSYPEVIADVAYAFPIRYYDSTLEFMEGIQKDNCIYYIYNKGVKYSGITSNKVSLGGEKFVCLHSDYFVKLTE